MGILETLTLIFVVLKLVGVIAWSWWWVLSPVWIPFAIAIAVPVLAFVIAVIVSIFAGLVAGVASIFTK
jgi:hypothetical protein